MPGNSFGNIFKLTGFGESHGEGIGGIIDGCPPGLEIDFSFIQEQLNRRRPGQSAITSPRQEEDVVTFLSGIFEGKTLGTPIAFLVRNKNSNSADYEKLKSVYRPGHADFVYEKKYGIRDYRGGGRSSARETIARVVAGAIAQLFLKKHGVGIQAFVKQIGDILLNDNYDKYDLAETEKNTVRCPDKNAALKMESLIKTLKESGDTCGGIIQCVISGLPAGLGEPVFDKFHAELAKAMLSINAAKGFEIGSGFESVKMKGSEMNDSFEGKDGNIFTKTNNSGGVQGGITNGMPVYFNVAFKPVSSIKKVQNTVDTDGNNTSVSVSGRHDPCVVPRAVPIVEAMAALVSIDYFLLQKVYR